VRPIEPSLKGCTVLVISHDFPPARSPQAIRAMAFTRRLAAEAAQVVVITRTRLPGFAEPTLPPNVRVERASPGWLEERIDGLVARRRHTEIDDDAPPAPGGTVKASPAALNWKGRIILRLRRAMDALCFPDGRAMWVRDAVRSLDELCAAQRPDVALVMHEPAASLVVGRRLGRVGVPWLADIADPVLAPYTPWHWRGRAARLEAAVLREASAISATNTATVALLAQRHGALERPAAVLPQGFKPQPAVAMPGGDTLRLVYTGRFYPFRDPAPLLEAVATTPGVELVIAGPEMPGAVLAAALRHPEAITLAGELGHRDALALQMTADVLVSVGNTGTAQTPGKVQEYFGAARPLLHLFHDAGDPAPGLVQSTRRGLACAARTDAVASTLRELRELKRSGALAARFDLTADAVAEYRWDAIAGRMAALLASLVPGGR
jgi:glycosyltransferase involved in cell wall biosynthesis